MANAFAKGAGLLSALLVVACDSRHGVVQDAVRVRRAGVKSESAWLAGDNIPGWEVYDYDCPILTGAYAAVVDLSDVWTSVIYLYGNAGDLGNQLLSVVTIADCTEKDCGEGSHRSRPVGSAPHVYASAVNTIVEVVYDKTGYYCEGCERADSYVISSGSLPLGAYGTDDFGLSHVEVCFSRLRPDEWSGVVYVTYVDNTLPHNHFDDALVQYPFDIYFGEHSAWDYSVSEGPSSELFDYDGLGIVYFVDVNYDNAWNWDAITDPDIRDAVYDRYTPYNVP